MNLQKLLLALFLSGFLSSTFAAELNSEKQKLSYSMGIYFGQSVKSQNIDLDIPAFLMAVEDSLKDSETKLTAEEMQNIFTDYKRKEQQAQAEKAKTNQQAGVKFLADNKSKEGVTQTESGLQYKVIKEGEGDIPGPGSVVLVHYRGTLIDGTEFDSSYARGEPAVLNVGGVIRGWQEALQMMKVGSKWQLFIPSDLAYGERSPGEPIGPNSTLIFDVELLEIKSK